MKKTLLLLTVFCALMACKKNSVDFSYSPTEPRAGQAVTFTNLSSSGEDWLWSFGDGATSTLRAPSHTYKKPGSYTVILKVDNKSSWTATKDITVYDTIPTFVCEDSVFSIYRNYTFVANVYNPYNYDILYEWTIDDADSIVSCTGTTLTCFFTRPDKDETVHLKVTMNEETTDIDKTFFIQDRKTNSVLLRTPQGDYRQRIFGARQEPYKLDNTASELLNEEQDTMQIYNGKEFYLSELQQLFPELEGFHIAHRKVYFRAEGLWVANLDGAYAVQIDEEPCLAMTLDMQDSRIYWANAKGVWYMPFIGSDNNKFVTTPSPLNDLKDVTKLAVDTELR